MLLDRVDRCESRRFGVNRGVQKPLSRGKPLAPSSCSQTRSSSPGNGLPVALRASAPSSPSRSVRSASLLRLCLPSVSLRERWRPKFGNSGVPCRDSLIAGGEYAATRCMNVAQETPFASDQVSMWASHIRRGEHASHRRETPPASLRSGIPNRRQSRVAREAQFPALASARGRAFSRAASQQWSMRSSRQP